MADRLAGSTGPVGRMGGAGGEPWPLAAALPRALRVKPPLWLLLLGGTAWGLHLLAFGAAAAPLGRAPVAGSLLAAAGLGWMLWAAWLFRQAGTTLRPTGQPAVLVEEGPYRLGRNPMYLGMAAVLVGAALALGVPLLLGAAAAFVAVVQRVHIPYEEARLQRHFGGWWRDYAGQVRRWL